MDEAPPTPGLRYEILVRGRLGARLGAAFRELALESRPGATALTGEFVDQTQLRRVLDQLADFGLEVVSVDAVS